MNICFVGLDNLPVLAPEYRQFTIGGESVQQTLLARALARLGHGVSMVAADYGQPDGAVWDSVRVFKAYLPDAGLPVLRFIHPRWTGLWSALARAGADVYYTSCAGMHVGLVALFCKLHGRRFVFRTASDSDCDPSGLLVRHARDRWLYAYGLRRSDAILVQTAAQASAMARGYGMPSRVAGMLVETSAPAPRRDIDILWVSNIRQVKRPDRLLDLARRLPDARIHMAGGPLPGEAPLYRRVTRAAAECRNVSFHGRLSYGEASELYGRARLLVNTSDVEGFPNSYLQAWARGVPVVSLLDPDGVIEREGLGVAAGSAGEIADAVGLLLGNATRWRAVSARCTGYMAREFPEARILAPYLDTFENLSRSGAPRRAFAAGKAGHA